MALVKDYGLSTSNDFNFGLTFAIPDNCMYSLTLLNKIYYVKVQLQKGQSVPSSTFMTCSANVTVIDDEVNVEFQQILDSITTVKPKMRVDNCA